ncbi:MAG: hypothetical protein AAF611_05500 [Bacteroidota bacterium]
MLQKILKIDGVSSLDKSTQKRIVGGNPCANYSGPFCFGVGLSGCGTCEEFQALPANFQMCVLVGFDCLNDFW